MLTLSPHAHLAAIHICPGPGALLVRLSLVLSAMVVAAPSESSCLLCATARSGSWARCRTDLGWADSYLWVSLRRGLRRLRRRRLGGRRRRCGRWPGRGHGRTLCEGGGLLKSGKQLPQLDVPPGPYDARDHLAAVGTIRPSVVRRHLLAEQPVCAGERAEGDDER